MKKEIKITLNGEVREVDVKSNETLLDVLRYKLGAKTPKCGCDAGDCGTCTVFFNGKTVRSCLILAIEADGAEVITLEGLMKEGELTPLQEMFLKQNAFQCGFCAPGMIISATELLGKNPRPTREEIKEALAGNLCRCTGYLPIVDTIEKFVNRDFYGNEEL